MDLRSDRLMLSKMDCLTRRQLQYLEDKYVTRTMKCVPDKFQEMCHMHLAFLLDLSGDKLELLLSEEEHDTKKKSGLSNVAVFKKREKTVTGLFGAPLTDKGVCLMMPLIKFLKMEMNICKEGLFRKPGNCVRMNTLRDLLIEHGPSLMIDAEVYTPYDVAGVLKEFLRELPEPLLTERHMEAHRQVLGLGRHASTTEEIARYRKKKLSALQLLMLLMPSPAQKMTLQVVRLLQRVADCPETKMTPTTLGTIFAPIFFLNRKVEASEVCSIVSLTEPAVAFMIEHAHDLFLAPQELVIDLANYWNRLEKSSPTPEYETKTENCQFKKSISGRTLNTNVCYLDRDLSRCDDVARNTQTELENLFAHVQSLPNTPHNLKLKKQILKATTTPTSSTKKHKRSKSISESIKKRFPSMGRSKSKNPELSRLSISSATSTSSNDESKTLTPLMSDLLSSPISSKGTANIRTSRPRHKRSNSSTALSECSPPKQDCTDKENLQNTQLQKETSQTSLTRQSSNFSNSLKENVCLSSPKFKSYSPSTDRNSVPKFKPLPLTLANSFSPKYHLHQSENEITYLPNYQPANKVKAPLTPRQFQQKHVSRGEHRSCKAPGTPVMPRTLLQMAQNNNALETSI